MYGSQHEARQQRQQQAPGPPQGQSGKRMRVVQDENGRLRTGSGRLLTDEECARVYQQMENRYAIANFLCCPPAFGTASRVFVHLQ